MDENTEFACVLINDFWRACVRPGMQWSMREMGISSGHGIRGRDRAIKQAEKFNAERSSRSNTGSVNTIPPIMGERFTRRRFKREETDSMELLELFRAGGQKIAIYEDGRTQVAIPVFMANAVRAFAHDKNTTVVDATVRLLAAGLESCGPETHDHCVMAALEIREEGER